MSTLTEIAEELSATERQIAETRMKAEAAVRKYDEKARNVAGKLQELTSRHKDCTEALVQQNEVQVQNLQAHAGKEIVAADEARSKAETRTHEMDHRRTQLESEAKTLEQEFKDLLQALDSQRAGHDRRFQEVREVADNDMGRRSQEAELTIRAISTYASHARGDAMSSLDEMHTNLHAKLASAGDESLERSRYNELHQLARSRAKPTQHFKQAKADLFQSWHSEWERCTPNRTDPSSPRSVRRHPPIEEPRGLVQAITDRHKTMGTPPVREKDHTLNAAWETMRLRHTA